MGASSGDINCRGHLIALRAGDERAGGITSCECAHAVGGTSALTLWSCNFHAGFFLREMDLICLSRFVTSGGQ